MVSFQSSISILDSHVSFQEAPELERSEVDVPNAVVDLLEPDVLAGAHGGDAHPLAISTDATVGAHVASLEAIRILERWEARRHFASGSLVE
jgi:hypothetical protein